jgi:NADH:ubiquinone oxidoreductase subunit
VNRPNYDVSDAQPGWHAWLSYLTDEPPTKKEYEKAFIQTPANPSTTQTWAAYRPYSTTRPTFQQWEPVSKR